MKASFPVNYNYHEDCGLIKEQLQAVFDARPTRVESLFDDVTEIRDGDPRFDKIKIIGFQTVDAKPAEEKLILKLYTKKSPVNEVQYMVQTGIYAGVLYHRGCTFNITSGYGDIFLYRMLSFTNEIFVDNDQKPATEKTKPDEFKLIIAFLFHQSFEKASLLGFPQDYTTVIERSTKVRGKVDLNTYLKNDIPFSGYLTSRYRSRQFVQPIIDVLYAASRKLDALSLGTLSGNVRVLQQFLKQHYSGTIPNMQTIKAAKKHSSLINPIYTQFSKALYYAEIILNESWVDADARNEAETTGYLFDISQLFEVYLEKLLRRNFPDWNVYPQYEVNTYNNLFFNRKMVPDLVLIHKQNGAVAVFDAKYKKMRKIPIDLDRTDFFQIHTYIQYFNSKVIAGGLLYPISSIQEDSSNSTHLFGLADHQQIRFIIDGISIDPKMNLDDLKAAESRLIERLTENILILSGP